MFKLKLSIELARDPEGKVFRVVISLVPRGARYIINAVQRDRQRLVALQQQRALTAAEQLDKVIAEDILARAAKTAIPEE